LRRPVIKSHPKEKVRAPGLGKLSKIWGFRFNIYAVVESIDFKFGTQFGWAIRPIIKSHMTKVGLGHGMVRFILN